MSSTSFIIEFPVNVHHEVDAMLKALLDEETDELEYEAAMRAILTFTSPSVTPGSEVHQRLLRVWLQADDVASSMIYATLVELYNFHKPGSHPSVWSPATPPKERRKFFDELLRLASVSDVDDKEQRNINAETMLEYYLVILSRDKQRLTSSSLTSALFDSKLTAHLIESAFECLVADGGITLRVSVLFQLIELVLEEEYRVDAPTFPGEALFIKKYRKLGEDGEECFISVFPAGSTKLRLLDKITQKEVTVDDKEIQDLRESTPNMKKLCEFYFHCHPRKKGLGLVVLMRLCAMTEIISTQKSKYSIKKAQKACDAFVDARMENLDRSEDKTEVEFLMKIQFLVRAYFLSLNNSS